MTIMKALIEEVPSHPCLWSTTDPDYKNLNMKTTSWEVVANNLNKTGMVMMCTNQRLLGTYEHSGIVTGTFYPPIATSQDQQTLGATSTSASQMYSTPRTTLFYPQYSTCTALRTNSANEYTVAQGGLGSPGSSSVGSRLSNSSGYHHLQHQHRSPQPHQQHQHQSQQQTPQLVSYDPGSAGVLVENPEMVSAMGAEVVELDSVDMLKPDSHEFDKYLKYGGAGGGGAGGNFGIAGHPQQLELLDSNHNYHQQHLPVTFHSSHYASHYSQGLLDLTPGLDEGDPYTVHGQHPHQQQQHHQQPPQSQQQQQIKTEEDFSVILADVRKTCYSS